MGLTLFGIELVTVAEKITLRAWDVRLFHSDEAHDQDPTHRRED
jgi:hypothetical protein